MPSTWHTRKTFASLNPKQSQLIKDGHRQGPGVILSWTNFLQASQSYNVHTCYTFPNAPPKDGSVGCRGLFPTTLRLFFTLVTCRSFWSCLYRTITPRVNLPHVHLRTQDPRERLRTSWNLVTSGSKRANQSFPSDLFYIQPALQTTDWQVSSTSTRTRMLQDHRHKIFPRRRGPSNVNLCINPTWQFGQHTIPSFVVRNMSEPGGATSLP